MTSDQHDASKDSPVVDDDKDSPVADDDFDDYLEAIAEVHGDRELPTLVSGYNPERLTDMYALFAAENQTEESAEQSGNDTETSDVENKGEVPEDAGKKGETAEPGDPEGRE